MYLYNFKDDYLKLLNLTDEEEVSEEAIRDTMALILQGGNEAAENLGKVLKQTEADAEALKAEKLRLARKQSQKEHAIDTMREVLRSWMLLTHQRKIKTGLFTFGLTKQNKVVLDVPEEALPIEFQKVTVKADTKALKDYLMRDEADLCGLAHFETVDTLTVR